MNPFVVALITFVATIAVLLAVLLALSGGNFGRLGLGWRCFLKALRDPVFAEKVQPLLLPPEPPKPIKPSGAPLRMLALLQREGRLIDFLLESIQAYSDDQIGAAVRKIHSDCQATVNEHLVLEPVVTHEEESIVEVPPGFDPSAIRLTGNVTGKPPFRGTLKHRGWRVKELKLAPPPEGQDEFVLMPAEVELP